MIRSRTVSDSGEDRTVAAGTSEHGAAPSLLWPGETFANRYEVRALLGEGGMGCVFRVRDSELDEEVALKVLRVELSNDASALERFRREVKLARRVTHPNVARTYDVGQHEHVRFLTMELVLGEPLSSLVEGGRRTSLPETLRMASDIARGLSAAHAAGVVHRDLKPDNVMRCPGTNGRTVITDFGIARLAEGVHASEDLKRTLNQIVGTPAYMAPEQLTGEPIDGRTDVYAFGIMLFEMLTGALPFQRASLLATMAARLAEDPPDPRAFDPAIPEPVALLITTAMARRRADRPDAETMLQTIERLRGGGDRHERLASISIAGSELADSQRMSLSVAVVPVDVSAGATWSGDDLGAALADGLSSLRGLRVLPPGAVRDAAESGGWSATARALGASWMVETSLRSEGGRGRARARLLDVEKGTQLWAAAPIDVAEGETFALEDRLVGAVTDALRERLGGATRRPTAPEVCDYYDRAREASRPRTVPCLREAVTILEAGLAKHPGDPWLLGLLGVCLVRLYGVTGSHDSQLAARAEEVSLRGIAADPTVGETYLAIGFVRIEQGEMRAAARAFQEALARSPVADAHTGLGVLLTETGKVEDGMRRFDVALRLEPHTSGAWTERARARALLGDRAGAEADLRQATAAGDAAASYALLVRLVMWWGDRPRAAELADALDRGKTGAVWEAAVPALRAFARDELFAEAPQLFERLMSGAHAASRSRCRVVEIAAEYFAATGQNEPALQWLERAESLPFASVLWMDRCPCLDAIRGDPRFARVRVLVAARAADIWR